jgi:hypothetical protein
MPRRSALLFAGAAAVAVAALGRSAAGAEELRTVVWQPPESPRRVDPMLTMTGAVMFGVPYTASIAVAAGSELAADRWLYLPVVGPIGDFVHRNTCTSWGCRGFDLGSVALPLVLNSVVQAAGLGVFIVSLARPSAPARRPRAAVRVVPTPLRDGAGVSAFGTF